jgi:DNA polymerase/3'-5' exonuclease PolX
LERYRGRTMRVSSGKDNAVFALSSGILLRVHVAGKKDWGVALIACTGSKAHLRKLIAVTGPIKRLRSNGPFPTETALYRKSGISFIQPELREVNDEPTSQPVPYSVFSRQLLT